MDLKGAHFVTPNCTWDLAKLNAILPMHLNLKIQGIPLPSQDVSDTPIWAPTSSGAFLVKSATWLPHELRPKPPWPFRWQMCHTSLTVRDTLFSCHIIPISNCPRCDIGTESMDQLYFNVTIQKNYGAYNRLFIGVPLFRAPILLFRFSNKKCFTLAQNNFPFLGYLEGEK